jgi:rhodanese-related sulfurtransferase
MQTSQNQKVKNSGAWMAKKQHVKRKQIKRSQQANTWVILGVLVLVALLGYGAWRLFSPSAAMPKEIGADEAYQKYQQGAFLLDVRTPEEWDDFHAVGATLIPLDELPNRVSEVPQDREIVVVCRSGNRSQQGRDILLGVGYQQVSSMAGGMNAWRDAGYPVE